MIDISDGLLADCAHLAEASEVTINVDPYALLIPDELRAASSAFNVDPLTWVLAGGDDHALLATFPADASLPEGFLVIGKVEEAGHPQVLVAGQLWEGEMGHEHFR